MSAAERLVLELQALNADLRSIIEDWKLITAKLEELASLRIPEHQHRVLGSTSF